VNDSHPTFAVVGHPNKGKSSIVATLAEDDSVVISPDPGTTRRARSFRMRIDDKVLYELVDTPGFQRPRSTLAWLREHERDASARPAVVREFVTAHERDERFHDECELLRPILDGAGILYVVDGAHPYGVEYEAEMEILRWTGQPRMALINLIGPGDHIEEWRRALNQYFSIVRVFDAQRADFARRLELLRAFRELGEGHAQWSSMLERAIATLERDRAARTRRAAAEIADLLGAVLSAQERAAAPEDSDEAEVSRRLGEQLKTRIRQREQQQRRAVQAIYHHAALAAQEQQVDLLQEDLFSERSFAVFGMSTAQLAVTGAATGALTGGAIDLAVGGASLLIGAGVGAVIGGLGAVFGAGRLAKVQVLGTPLGGHRVIVGPITSPNLPWVLLGRALLHQRLIAERNHAVRDSLVLDTAAGTHLADTIDSGTRKRMAARFARIRENGGLSAADREALIDEIVSLSAAAGSPA
jgi:hypothetical protein